MQVIDASVGVKWVVPEEDADIARRLIGADDLLVPALFYFEVGNAIWKKARRGELLLDLLLPEMAILRDLTEPFDDAEFAARALALAVELDHPIYDCLYLAAAEAFDVPLITADRRFIKAIGGTRYRSLVRDLSTLERDRSS